MHTKVYTWTKNSNNMFFFSFFNRGRISSFGKALDCRAGGRGLDSRTNTTVFALQAARPSRGSDDHVKCSLQCRRILGRRNIIVFVILL